MGQQMSRAVSVLRRSTSQISQALGGDQATSSAASQVLQIRQKFTDDILKSGQLRAESIDRMKREQLEADLDALFQGSICIPETKYIFS